MRLLCLVLGIFYLAGPLWAIGDADDAINMKKWVEYYPDKRPRHVYTGYRNGDEIVQHGFDIYYYDQEKLSKQLGFIFRNGKKHGKYGAWYPDGQVKEEGQFADGERDGTWTYYAANGIKLQEITYDHGKKHGPYKRWDAMGALETERSYDHDEKTGVEKLYFSNGQLKALLTWDNGTLSGRAASWYVNGQQKETLTFVDGKKDGAVKEFFQDGSIQQVSTYDHGVLDGPWERYDKTGKALEKGIYRKGQVWTGEFRELGDLPGEEWLNLYRDGQIIDGVLYQDGAPKNGTVQLWHINGNVQRQYQFVEGRRNGKEYWWYPDGQLNKEMTWIDNRLDGTLAEWYPDGTAKWMVTMRDGKRDGVETRWTPRGLLICRGEYRDGKPWDGLFTIEEDDGGERLQKFKNGVPVETTAEDIRPQAPPKTTGAPPVDEPAKTSPPAPPEQ